MAKIQTVLGQITASELGRTLTHEHFSLNFDHFYVPPPQQLNNYLNTNRIAIDNVGLVRQYPYGSRYNIHFNDDDTHKAVLDDIKAYRKFGGGSIVENTTHGLDRNLDLFCDIAKETGVHVIAGTGHYIEAVQNASNVAMTVENMVDLYTKELTIGSETNQNGLVKCGFIGEVGSIYPITDFEKRSIQATGIVQSQLGCGVSFHPGRDPAAPFEIIRIYLEAGGKADKCVMSHLDRTIFDDGQLLEFSDLGTYCQFDLFGTECSYYQLNPATDMPSDGVRIDRLAKLIKEGKEKILLSHDIHTKHRLMNFGGHGYAHILNNVLPRFKYRGVSDEIVDKITIENPGKWLEYNCN